MDRAEVAVDPVQGEFFNTEAVRSMPAALVREAIQNSLDAAASPTARVRLRFFLSGRQHALRRGEELPGWETLNQHLRAPGNGLRGTPDPRQPAPFLAVEDFGTSGLEGDPGQYQDQEDTSGKNAFYYFWRNVGRSGKSHSDRGRWGLGKNVFPASSAINAFYGVTVRGHDGRRLLLGQAVLKIHSLRGERHCPYGYYGRIDKGGFAAPLEDDAAAQFCSAFGLQRQNEPGLSIVIPYPDAEITAETLKQSVIEQYFFPLIAESLSVTVATPQGEEVLEAASLRKAIWKLGAEFERGMRPLVDLAGWAWEAMSGPIRIARQGEAARAPAWSPELTPAEIQSQLREDFAAGRPVGLRVPVRVQPKGSDAELSHFDVFLKKDPAAHARPIFIREGVPISEVRAPRERGCLSLVVIEHRPLAALLGDAENPAHTEWQERSTKFRDRYVYGPSTLRFVKNSVNELLKILGPGDAADDRHALLDIFSLPAPAPDTGRSRAARAAGGVGPPEAAPPVTLPATVERPAALSIDSLAGGFAVRAAGPETPSTVEIEVAYDTRQGHPFKKYHRADFQLDQEPVRVTIHGGQAVECRDNRLLAGNLGAGFRIAIVGFDSQRDLRVRIEPRFREAGA
jgi:hypothetical protein